MPYRVWGVQKGAVKWRDIYRKIAYVYERRIDGELPGR